MKEVTLLFPHQLFEENPAIEKNRKIYLIEEYLFFKQYKFHKQKICLHRASMKFYHNWLKDQKYKVGYIESINEQSDIRELIPYLKSEGIKHIHHIEPVDDWLQKRLKRTAAKMNIKTTEYSSPMFINSINDIEDFFQTDGNLLQTKFYIEQRKKRKILLQENTGKPDGGKWSFDAENRKKYPRDKMPPAVTFPKINQFQKEAKEYTYKYFKKNPGEVNKKIIYPVTFKDSKNWLAQFHANRFEEFGDFEDAMVAKENILNHSILTPMLNTGLLTPQYVLNETTKYYDKNSIPINSAEGFIRQIIGWREFIRGMYYFNGVNQRTTNYWKFGKKIPDSFYTATTGIEPLDVVIQKVLDTGYCHHIERLMILGNFMLLCELDPNEVYRWFMELFIDAYDWVMVPNVYGMSQFADGGLMATKPYISGSNYILKMSDFLKGDWQKTWDGLFWRFMHVHREFFLQNPRLGMLVRTFDKMSQEKRDNHLKIAENYLNSL